MEERLYKAMEDLKSTWISLMDVCLDCEIDANDYIVEDYPFELALEDLNVVSWCETTMKQIRKIQASRADRALEDAKSAIKCLYEELSKRDKPAAYQIGGTYYGSRELRSLVGNMLDLMEGTTYQKYDYGMRSNYEDVYAIRIGGAYKTNEDEKKLLERLKELLQNTKGYCLIYDYGTNFTVIGIGRAVY